MSDTLELRAAKYYGWQDKPRCSIRLNNTSCLIVTKHRGRTLLMSYIEGYLPRGEHVSLTDRALAELVEALSSVEEDR